MRDINRIDPFLESFKILWKKYPDLRFGQLVYVLGPDDKDIFYVEDAELLKKINQKNKQGDK